MNPNVEQCTVNYVPKYHFDIKIFPNLTDRVYNPGAKGLMLSSMVKIDHSQVRKIFYSCTEKRLQYRHLIPAQLDRTSVSAWLYHHPWIPCQKMTRKMTSQLNVGSIRKLSRTLICLAYFLTCYPWVFLHYKGTSIRTVDW